MTAELGRFEILSSILAETMGMRKSIVDALIDYNAPIEYFPSVVRPLSIKKQEESAGENCSTALLSSS